jgi:PEP-CTERM motif
MKHLGLLPAALALLTCAVAAPAMAQTTWHFGNGGNCDLVGSKATLDCSAGANNTLRVEGYGAAAGSQYVLGTLTDQGRFGMGFRAAGETSSSPQHAFDNHGAHELVLLNFGSNKVVVTGVALGWSFNDTDASLLRWAGVSSPSEVPTANVTTASLLTSGWELVGSADLDGTAQRGRSFGQNSIATGVAATAENSSSWWIISSYFGAATGQLDAGNDYFKLLAVHTDCVSNSSGGGCNTPPRQEVPEPGSLALVGLALAAAAVARRRRLAA